MHVLVAPDKYKGCLTAAEVAAALAGGLRAARPELTVTELPIADGGDGTVAAALSRGYDPVRLTAAGPTGVAAEVAYARRGDRAVVELAAVCGLERLPDGRLDPLGASTAGLGEVIRHAVAHGAAEVVIGIGGSASTDGGAGLLQALGARLVDAAGAELPRGGAALAQLARVDLEPVRELVGTTRFVLASDVENPLLGPDGAAAVFGPQKGADTAEVGQLDRALERWAAVIDAATGTSERERPGAGAAGGTGYAALAVLGAELRSGADLVLELVGFDDALGHADLVITGEGSLDEQSLSGKGPVQVARIARSRDIPAVAVVGHTRLPFARVQEAGLTAVYPLSDLQPDRERSIAEAAALLHTAGSRIAFRWCDPEHPRRT